MRRHYTQKEGEGQSAFALFLRARLGVRQQLLRDLLHLFEEAALVVRFVHGILEVVTELLEPLEALRLGHPSQGRRFEPHTVIIAQLPAIGDSGNV
jgi:hypothetical protein